MTGDNRTGAQRGPCVGIWRRRTQLVTTHACDGLGDRLDLHCMYINFQSCPPQSAKLRLRLATLETVIARPMANSGFLDKSALLTMACCETETDANACSPNAALPLSPYACLAAGERFWPHGSALNLEPCTYGDGSGACDQCHGLDTDSRFAVG